MTIVVQLGLLLDFFDFIVESWWASGSDSIVVVHVDGCARHQTNDSGVKDAKEYGGIDETKNSDENRNNSWRGKIVIHSKCLHGNSREPDIKEANGNLTQKDEYLSNLIGEVEFLLMLILEHVVVGR